MKNSTRENANRYLKIVRWSDEDGCYVGTCPDLFFGGCHGDDESEVYAELCEICEEVIEGKIERGIPLPTPTVWRAEHVPSGVDKSWFEWNPSESSAVA